jgi:hypothetical protein
MIVFDHVLSGALRGGKCAVCGPFVKLALNLSVTRLGLLDG